jgi:hypothetical protein
VGLFATDGDNVDNDEDEDETCSWILLDTEAPRAPKKEQDGAYYEAEHGVTVSVGPPAETSPPIFENAGQPLKQCCGHPQKYF